MKTKVEKVTKPLSSITIKFGCDPEFFFEKKGKIIGSEKIIDLKKGLKIKKELGRNGSTSEGESKFIVDGVQVELNPRPDTCRARLGNEISTCFRQLYQKLKEDKNLKINFEPTVKITKKELLSLNKKSRVFGCAPSKNTETKKENKITVNATNYRYRSAGGHIHIGKPNNWDTTANKALEKPEQLVQILDIIVGNTCVMIDKNPGNIERRKIYGRAGEYRTPEHGVEYRTLSNFWLRSYPLMSFVMSLTRLSVNILASSTEQNNYEKELLSLVDMQKIREAINKNNEKLAKKNFKKIKEFLLRIQTEHGDFPLSGKRMEAFELFAKKGINHYFKEDPLEHWIKLPEGHECGWETFLNKKVIPELKK